MTEKIPKVPFIVLTIKEEYVKKDSNSYQTTQILRVFFFILYMLLYTKYTIYLYAINMFLRSSLKVEFVL